jgi:PAS domain S-box-containing protein
LDKTQGCLKTLIHTIPDLVWLKDEHGVYLFCNHALEQLYDVDEQAIIGKTDYDFIDPHEADFFHEMDQEAIKSGKPLRYEEWQTFTKDNYRALMETIKTPMYNSKGDLIGVIGIARDLTHFREIENDNREKEVQYQNLANAGLALIWASGKDKQCNYFNDP